MLEAQCNVIFGNESKTPTISCKHTAYRSKHIFLSEIFSIWSILGGLATTTCFTKEKAFEIASKIGPPTLRPIEHFCNTCKFIFLSEFFEHFYNVDSSVALIISLWKSNCPITKFIYKRSSIWLLIVLNICSIIDKYENHIVFFRTLSQMQRYIVLFKQRHWKLITFNTPLILKLMKFVHKVQCMHYHETDSMLVANHYVSLIVITYWLSYYYKFSRKYISNSEYQRTLLLLNEQIKKIKLILIQNQDPYALYMNEYKQYKLTMDKCSSQFWKEKLLRTKCFREKCNITRMLGHSKFVKCSWCLTATYCSKKCAKIDWKFGYHKQCCKKLAAIRKKRMDFELSDM
eukprot:516866_1